MEELELLLSEVTLPNLYDYSKADPADVHHMSFKDGILVSCKILKPIVKPDLYEDAF